MPDELPQLKLQGSVTASEFGDAAMLRPPGGVVGIGGSAGALDGFERFFLGLPPVSGLAFVVVPHLDPNHLGLMPDILKRCTNMPVVQIEDGMALQADRVHVIPPGRSLSVLGGILHLGELTEARGMVVDTFFEALAADQHERTVGIVLSGLGSDGTRGIRAIKRQGGRVLVQDPETAEYASMPGSAAATQLADDVLPADELAERLLSLTELTRLLGTAAATKGEGQADAPLQKILRVVRARTGHDFSRYKRTTLVRRIERRMRTQRIQDVTGYLQLLEETPAEVEALFQDFTVNVTSFFRDVEAFDDLKVHLRASLRQRQQEQEVFRIWVVACSTGEEAYSVAIVLHELVEELGGDHPLKIQVFATDIDRWAIDRARQGLYSKDIAYLVSPERLSRYFFLKGDQYQVRADIRASVVFALHNTFGDPPFTRLDLLCCRNMLIYVEPALQHQMLALFRYALRPGGVLFLGASETVGAERDHFQTLNQRWKLYRRGEGLADPPPMPMSDVLTAQRMGQRTGSGEGLPSRSLAGRPEPSHQAQKALLDDYAPPTVVVNLQGELLFVHGRTARFLELSPGQGRQTVFEMARGDLRHALPAAVRQALTEGRKVVRSGLQVEVEGSLRTLDLIVNPLPGTDTVLAMFQERPDTPEREDGVPPEKMDRVLVLEQELQRGRESLHATVEERAISMEEVRSTNEELQSTVEELQSSNEELMSSKEEFQSLNEELTAINAEHQLVIRNLAQANDDTRYLLEGAGTAMVFLDNDLKIRRFTPSISRIIQLSAGDLGRPITDLHIDLQYDHLIPDVRRVLLTLEPVEVQLRTRSDAWYLMRLSPYRTDDNRIEGVVMALTNIDLIKTQPAP